MKPRLDNWPPCLPRLNVGGNESLSEDRLEDLREEAFVEGKCIFFEDVLDRSCVGNHVEGRLRHRCKRQLVHPTGPEEVLLEGDEEGEVADEVIEVSDGDDSIVVWENELPPDLEQGTQHVVQDAVLVRLLHEERARARPLHRLCSLSSNRDLIKHLIPRVRLCPRHPRCRTSRPPHGTAQSRPQAHPSLAHSPLRSESEGGGRPGVRSLQRA
mmetsp:Transcript_17594/g.40625  ORF Transcript_17594/g.40625 Transcript_17594/m.40625 type:complete len:213 (-) Transcript_17594:184-822(-)